MKALVNFNKSYKDMSRKELFFRLLMVMVIALAVASAVMPVSGDAFAACTSAGVDDTTSDPCLYLPLDGNDGLVANIFKWASFLMPVLIPLAAIGIGLQFGADILGGVKSFFGSFKLR